MSDIPQLIERNRRFAESFTHGGLSMRPRLSTFIVACVDARVDPGRIFDLELGDAVVMRNAGGRVTAAVLRDLNVLGFLASRVPGGTPMTPEVVVVHHTDCGMSRLVDPEAQRVLAERMGVEPSQIAAMAIPDPYQSVQADIQLLRDAPGVPDSLVIAGFVYDVATGLVAKVEPSTSDEVAS